MLLLLPFFGSQLVASASLGGGLHHHGAAESFANSRHELLQIACKLITLHAGLRPDLEGINPKTQR